MCNPAAYGKVNASSALGIHGAGRSEDHGSLSTGLDFYL
jgi:hypothetical protein